MNVDGPQVSTARSIKDPIHDFISLSPFICAFIDTRQFQRLRAIKQLGTSYYVWPGASHNRFEHCIGVAHLAKMMVERLQAEQPELNITDRDVRCVQLAGLCHDLGHGPWSHVWDQAFIPSVLPGQSWTHEDASEMMFDDLIVQNDISIPQEDINLVKDLIKGEPNHSKNNDPPEKSFLFQIVANKRNGIDVDKFDYIARDTHAIGDHGVFLVKRLIDSARVIDNEICYHIKDANQIYELCYTRFSNHKRIYNHKTAKAIEYMIIDGLKAAEAHLKIAKRIMDPSKYVFLTDDIMCTIEASSEPELARSRAIFERIRKRDLYKLVDFKTFSWDYRTHLKEWVTPEAIAAATRQPAAMARSDSQESDGPLDPAIVNTLTKDHIIVDLSTMHYGMKEKNPMHYIKFYSKYNINKAAIAGDGDFSTLMPQCFGEVMLRVYTKDVRYFGIIQAGYRAVLESLPELSSAHPLTPPLTEGHGSPSAFIDSRNSSFALDTPGPRRDAASAPGTGKGTPFMNNSFTKVPKNFIPGSPTQEHRKPRRDGSGLPDSRKSSFHLDTPAVAPELAPSTPAANAHASLPKVPQPSAPASPTQEYRRTRRKRGGDSDPVEGPSLLKRRRG